MKFLAIASIFILVFTVVLAFAGIIWIRSFLRRLFGFDGQNTNPFSTGQNNSSYTSYTENGENTSSENYREREITIQGRPLIHNEVEARKLDYLKSLAVDANVSVI